MIMKKYLIIIVMISNIHIANLSPCPCEFSPDDQRPFFEQYEVKNNDLTQQNEEGTV